jgi:hypothetical protein
VDLTSVETNMVSLLDRLLDLHTVHCIIFVKVPHVTYIFYACKVFFDIVDSHISPGTLCQVLEKRNVLAMPASSKR